MMHKYSISIHSQKQLYSQCRAALLQMKQGQQMAKAGWRVETGAPVTTLWVPHNPTKPWLLPLTNEKRPPPPTACPSPGHCLPFTESHHVAELGDNGLLLTAPPLSLASWFLKRAMERRGIRHTKRDVSSCEACVFLI